MSLINVAEDAALVVQGIIVITYLIGFVCFAIAANAFQRNLSTGGGMPMATIGAALLGGVILLNAPAFIELSVATLYGSSVQPDAILSTITGSNQIEMTRRAVFQLLAVLGWIFAIKGLLMFTIHAPRGEATYTQAFWTTFAGVLGTSPNSFLELFAQSVNDPAVVNMVHTLR